MNSKMLADELVSLASIVFIGVTDPRDKKRLEELRAEVSSRLCSEPHSDYHVCLQAVKEGLDTYLGKTFMGFIRFHGSSTLRDAMRELCSHIVDSKGCIVERDKAPSS